MALGAALRGLPPERFGRADAIFPNPRFTTFRAMSLGAAPRPAKCMAFGRSGPPTDIEIIVDLDRRVVAQHAGVMDERVAPDPHVAAVAAGAARLPPAPSPPRRIHPYGGDESAVSGTPFGPDHELS